MIDSNTISITAYLYGDCSNGVYPPTLPIYGYPKYSSSEIQPPYLERGLISLNRQDVANNYLDIEQKSPVVGLATNLCEDDSNLSCCFNPGTGCIGSSNVRIYKGVLSFDGTYRQWFFYPVLTPLASNVSNITDPNDSPLNIAYIDLDKYSGTSPKFYHRDFNTVLQNSNVKVHWGASDSDSLSYEITGFPINLGGSGGYTFPFTGLNPFSTIGPYVINNQGETEFYPSQVESPVLFVKVNEYRNGELIGFTIRMRVFRFLANTSGQSTEFPKVTEASKTPVDSINAVPVYELTTIDSTIELGISSPADKLSYWIPESFDRFLESVQLDSLQSDSSRLLINFKLSEIGPTPVEYAVKLRSQSCPYSMDRIFAFRILSENCSFETDTISYCNTDFELPTISSSNNRYNWSPGGVLKDSAIANPILSNYTSLWLKLETNLCRDSIYLDSLTRARFSLTGDTTARQGDTVPIFVSVSSNSTYQWQPRPDTVSTFPGGFSIVADRSQVYFLELISTEGCTKLDSILIDVTSIGISNSIEEYGIIYPNPAEGLVNISLPVESGKISLINSVGQLAHEQVVSSSEESLDVSELARGVYILRVESDRGTFSKKLILR